MDLKDACRLREAWGDRACSHPQVERERHFGVDTGDEVCAGCGRVITRDPSGQPIPSPAGAA